MFYPVESLKRGGRFYMCWVADSWPLRFAAITHKQLWSQDIRKLCDDLMEVMTNESGRPINRFSLRLSSQLMRGLVRLYERKVTVFLGDLCMLNAHVFKNANKKSTAHETTHHVKRPLPQLARVQVEVIPAAPANGQTVEEMLLNSGNIVVNIQDITLKEAAIPDFQLPPNDGFGEEHPDQALQLLGDRTVEQMLQQTDTSAAQHSALEPLDRTAEQSHDKSRLHLEAPTMERISEHDVTLFRKSTAEGLQLPEEIEKDMPALPDIPAPAPEPQPEPVPEPLAEKQSVEPMELEAIPPPEAQKVQPEPAQEKQPENEPDVTIDLEELEQDQLATRKRRAKPRLIVDKRTKLSGAFLRARIDNLHVELRCEDSSEDIVDARVPWELLSRRPARAGHRLRANMASVLVRLYQTRLMSDRVPFEERALPEPARRITRAILEKIPEEEEPIPPVPAAVDQSAQIEQPITAPEVPDLNMTGPRDVIGDLNMTAPQDVGDLSVMAPRDLNVTGPQDLIGDLNVTGPRDVTGDLNVTGPPDRPSVQPMEVDFCELPTQKLETLKRASEHEVAAKRRRLSGYTCFKESQKQQLQKEDEPAPVHQELDKENIPPAVEQTQRLSQRNVSTLLQEAGLADAQPRPEIVVQPPPEPQVTETRRQRPSESSETPLGSLDRTKVSLGDSVQTTDSQRFIRNQWGIEGTMTKILNGIKAGMIPVTVESLVAKGPLISGYRNIIAARCFSSILKLKQHSFINIVKDPDTLEIRDIKLGPMFDGIE